MTQTAKELRDRVDLLNVVPGVTIDEIREAAGLGPCPDSEVGGTILNIPWELGD